MNTTEQLIGSPEEQKQIEMDESTQVGTTGVSPPDPPPHPQPARASEKSKSRAWRFILSIIGLALTAGLIYWKRLPLHGITAYIPVILPTIIAFGQFLFKDRHSYKPSWSRWVLLTCIVLAAGGGFLYQAQQIADKAASAARADAVQKAQDQNTKSFLVNIQGVYTELNNLKNKITTKDLQDKLVKVNAELEKTRSALAGPPPVSLILTLVAFPPLGKAIEAITDIQLPVDSVGVVHVPFFVYNPDDRAAEGGELTITICNGCKFSREPNGFKKVERDLETRRVLEFQHINVKTQIADLAVDIIPPAGAARIEIGILIKCTTCTVPREPSKLVIYLARTFPKPLTIKIPPSKN